MTQSLPSAAECLEMKRGGLTRKEISNRTGLSFAQVKRRLTSALKAERLDPQVVRRLADEGITDLAGLHSGWLINKKSTGKSGKGSKGSSLYFFLGPDEEKIDFADAMRDVLSEIPRLPPLDLPAKNHAGEGYANWIALADLHMGAEYSSPEIEADFNSAVDDLVRRMPAAEKAVLIELGDLLDMNDHKGVTPASGNPLDVRRSDYLKTVQSAVRILRRAAYRLSETHAEVELHLIKGNHDTTAYVAVLLALEAHFEENPRINVVVSDHEYRVVSWGKCAAFPHHGDTLKWPQLKDVFADQFADEWAAAKAFRIIMTAHLHHDRSKDLAGCYAQQFRTLHRPNDWAKARGLFSYGALSALTVHAERGEEYRTISNIRPMARGHHE